MFSTQPFERTPPVIDGSVMRHEATRLTRLAALLIPILVLSSGCASTISRTVLWSGFAGPTCNADLFPGAQFAYSGILGDSGPWLIPVAALDLLPSVAVDLAFLPIDAAVLALDSDCRVPADSHSTRRPTPPNNRLQTDGLLTSSPRDSAAGTLCALRVADAVGSRDLATKSDTLDETL